MKNLCLFLAVIAAVLSELTMRQKEEIATLRVQLAMRPRVEASKRVEKTAQVARGASKTTKTVVTAPDGTKTATTVKESAPETIQTDTRTAETRTETPVAAPEAPKRTRYVGVGLDPLANGLPRRVRAGLTLWDFLDAGLGWEPQRAPTDGALQLEAAYRF